MSRRIVLEFDDADYDAVQAAIAQRQTFQMWPDPVSDSRDLGEHREAWAEPNPLADGSNIAGLAIAEICRGWMDMMACSTVKPTPGPWKAMQGVDGELERWGVYAAYGDKAWHVATVENGAPGDTLKTEGATAHLIAAAPQLFDACKAVQRSEYYTLCQVAGVRLREGDRLVIEALNAALAAAQGSES